MAGLSDKERALLGTLLAGRSASAADAGASRLGRELADRLRLLFPEVDDVLMARLVLAAAGAGLGILWEGLGGPRDGDPEALAGLLAGAAAELACLELEAGGE